MAVSARNAHREGDARIANVTLHYLMETDPAPGAPPQIRRVQTWEEQCGTS